MVNNGKKELISIEVIKTLKSRFEKFPEDSLSNRNAPFHEAFLNAFSHKLKDNFEDAPYFISLSSWLHGLNTTLGQSFFESVAHILSSGEKKEFTGKKNTQLKITTDQESKISNLIIQLKNRTQQPNVTTENELIFDLTGEQETAAMDFTADNFIESGSKIEAIELKSVKPNAGEMRGEKQKILIAKASLKNKHPNKEIFFFIGFPFDPTSKEPTKFDKLRFMSSIIEFVKFFHPDEVLVGSEMWDRLSGETNTMEQLLSIINSISDPSFPTNFNFLNNYRWNVDEKQYIHLLEKWNLITEKSLFDEIKKNTLNNKIYSNVEQLFNKELFDKDGAYNNHRHRKIRELLNK